MIRLSRIRLAAAGAAVAAALAWHAAPALAETVRLTLVQTNDIDRMEEDHGRGGIARLAAVVKAARAEGNAIFVHSGDTLSPSLLSGIDKGAHMIDLLGRIGLDIMVPGNHEFDFGPENFRARITEAKFTVISSNLREADGTAPAGTVDSRIMEVEGVKIGFYGLTTEDTRQVSSPGDISILPSIETGRAKAKALREAGADIVVAVVHTPLAVDMLLVREDAADIVLSGHDEHLLTYYDGRHVLTESGSQADYVVLTELSIDKQEKDGKASISWQPQFRILDTAQVEPDGEAAAHVKSYLDKLDAELNVEIGMTETRLDSRRASVRTQETAIGNLIADAMRASVAADVAITNGGGIRGDREYEAGTTLTRRDILAELPFGNKTTKLELTGADIKAALENGLSQVREVAGRFPQVSGMHVRAKLSNPPGERVLSVTVGDAPLDPEKIYTLATNDFMARGGDGYTAFTRGKVLVSPNDAQLMASQVIDYVAAKGTVAPKVEGRIVTE